MNIKRAKEEIVNTVKAYLQKDEEGEYLIPAIRQRPVLLIGAPGIGKTAIMEQAARECNIGLVAYTMTHHTRQSAMGLPFISKKTYGGEEKSVTEYTMSEIIAAVYDRMESTGLKEGILFIDEINCVSETLAPVMLQFLQGKSFGNAKVPAGWIIVAAGNPAEYNRSVREFDVVTLDRVKMINVEPDYDVWREYARMQGIHGAIVSYLDARRDNFYKIETTVDGKHFVTARGWEDLSCLLYAYERLGLSVDKEIVGEYICAPATATDFANYLELYYVYEKTYNMESIFAGNADPMLNKRLSEAPFDEKVSVISILLGRLSRGFRDYAILENTVDNVFDALKTFRKNMQTADRPPISIFADIIQSVNAAYTRKKEAGLYASDDDKSMVKTINVLEDMSRKLAGDGTVDAGSAFELVRTEFEKLNGQREQMCDRVSAELNNTYVFVENAFGESPQLVLFTTELAAGFYSMHFIEENGCEAFYRNNKGLIRAE